MKLLPDQLVEPFFADLAAEYRVRVPIRLSDGARGVGEPGDGPVALEGGALPGKPTAPFFPQQGLVFTAVDREIVDPAPPPAPLLVAGFTPADLACLSFVDRFFEKGWRDDLYFRLRDGAVIVGVSGFTGPEGAFLPPAGGGCDLELVRVEGRWLAVPYSDTGGRLVRQLAHAPADAYDAVRQAAAGYADELEPLLERASQLMRADRVPDSFWSEIADRCIACTGCTMVCPTCTCFGVQDHCGAGRVERSRLWDSCQLDGFMREASGHNPMGSEMLRTRRRIHHKLVADPTRWGTITCFRCGRCDAVCPTGIGMVAVAREIVNRF